MVLGVVTFVILTLSWLTVWIFYLNLREKNETQEDKDQLCDENTNDKETAVEKIGWSSLLEKV